MGSALYDQDAQGGEVAAAVSSDVLTFGKCFEAAADVLRSVAMHAADSNELDLRKVAVAQEWRQLGIAIQGS